MNYIAAYAGAALMLLSILILISNSKLLPTTRKKTQWGVVIMFIAAFYAAATFKIIGVIVAALCLGYYIYRIVSYFNLRRQGHLHGGKCIRP